VLTDTRWIVPTGNSRKTDLRTKEPWEISNGVILWLMSTMCISGLMDKILAFTAET
jgi:hypothetical protein